MRIGITGTLIAGIGMTFLPGLGNDIAYDVIVVVFRILGLAGSDVGCSGLSFDQGYSDMTAAPFL
jgi:hypothetical protein